MIRFWSLLVLSVITVPSVAQTPAFTIRAAMSQHVGLEGYQNVHTYGVTVERRVLGPLAGALDIEWSPASGRFIRIENLRAMARLDWATFESEWFRAGPTVAAGYARTAGTIDAELMPMMSGRTDHAMLVEPGVFVRLSPVRFLDVRMGMARWWASGPLMGYGGSAHGSVYRPPASGGVYRLGVGVRL
jgi:hypothetical protein